MHCDYVSADDIHIKIFDNRAEEFSSGPLLGHITEANIFHERFLRKCAIVRLINKCPNPPNKVIGDGLNTAFQAMRKMKLKDHIIRQSVR